MEATILPPGPYRAAWLSTPVRQNPDTESVWVTELVSGELVRVLSCEPGWAQVVVPGQPSSLDPRGYPGWVPVAALHPEDGPPEWQAVAAAAVALLPTGRSLTLPMGTLLWRANGSGREGETAARLASGERVRVPSSLLARWPAPKLGREELLRALRDVWKDQRYVWGGTSTVTGVDCSGLVFRTHQRIGISVPRDAADQFEHAPSRVTGGLSGATAGDLVFFQSESNPAIDHVGVYLGDGLYVSAYFGAGTISVHPVSNDRFVAWASYLPPTQSGP
ncbi:MAG: C40 family peptidase [Chloroflexota bacterium]|nr:C40 family peptidase [Chloroflexota bacterium]